MSERKRPPPSSAHRPRTDRGRPATARDAPRDPAPPRDAPRAPLELTFGLRASLAVFERRRAEIMRVSWSRAVESSIGELLAWASREEIVNELLTDAELASVSGSAHHEGLCVAARPRAWTPPGALADLLASAKGAAIALDRVRNAYNVGAVLRTAAFFGMDAAILGAPAPHPALAPDAVRVAEGGPSASACAARPTSPTRSPGSAPAAPASWAQTRRAAPMRSRRASRGRSCWWSATSARG
jgi:TrmH RNA methyltransferase